MRTHSIDMPVAAMQLQAAGKDGGLETETSRDGAVRLRRFRAYSGGLIEGHWFWDKLAIDLGGIRFEKTRYPILKDHLDEFKIGHSGVPIVGNDLSLDPRDIVFLDNEHAAEFLKDIGAGFPFEASIYAVPRVVEEVEPGASVEVNGYKFVGPGNIWRECVYRESSVCVFGWDRQSQVGLSASAGAENTMRVKVKTPSPRRIQMPNVFKRALARQKMSFADAVRDPDVLAEVARKLSSSVDSEEVKKQLAKAVDELADDPDKEDELADDSEKKKKGLADDPDKEDELAEDLDKEDELADDPEKEDNRMSAMTEEEAIAALEGIRINFPHLLESGSDGGSEGGVEAMANDSKNKAEMAALRRDNHALAKRILDGERRLAMERAQRIRDGFASMLPEAARGRLTFPFDECYSAENNSFDKGKFAKKVQADAEDLMRLVGQNADLHTMSGGYGGGLPDLGYPIVGGGPSQEEVEADATEWAKKFAAKFGINANVA